MVTHHFACSAKPSTAAWGCLSCTCTTTTHCLSRKVVRRHNVGPHKSSNGRHVLARRFFPFPFSSCSRAPAAIALPNTLLTWTTAHAFALLLARPPARSSALSLALSLSLPPSPSRLQGRRLPSAQSNLDPWKSRLHLRVHG